MARCRSKTKIWWHILHLSASDDGTRFVPKIVEYGENSILLGFGDGCQMGSSEQCRNAEIHRSYMNPLGTN